MAQKWRYRLVKLTGTGTDTDPIRPNLTGESYVMLAQQGQNCLIKQRVDETAPLSPGLGIIAESDTSQPFTTDAQGVVTFQPWGVRGTATFSAPEVTAIKAWLNANGYASDVAAIGVSVKTRQDLMNLFLQRFPGITLDLMSSGFDVAG